MVWGVERGKFLERLVGPPRFELGTSSTPRKRATRLRHGPTQRHCSLREQEGVAAGTARRPHDEHAKWNKVLSSTTAQVNGT